MRILSLGNCPLDPTLGSGKTRLARIHGLRELGHTITPYDSRALLRGPWQSLGYRLGLAVGARRLLARIDWREFDLIEFCGEEFWWATANLQRQGKRPMIVAHTDGLELQARERLQAAGLLSPGRIERWFPFIDLPARSAQAFAAADRFVALAPTDLAYVLARGLFMAGHAKAITPGLDAEFIGRNFRTERENVVVFFGSWTERKGIKHVVPVITEFLAAQRDWRFLIVGASGSEPAIRSSFDPAVAGRIEVAPRLSTAEIVGRLDCARVIFAPSEYEGFGLATAEAMACGCAAVVTPTGFAASLAPQRDAMVCNFGDGAAMLRALDELARSTDTWIRIAQAGWQRVQLLQWPRAIEQLECTYREWLHDWRR